MSSGIQAQRMALLGQKSEKLFHIKDLAKLWNIQNPGNLRVTLKRYVDSGLLFRIYRGFYSILPLERLKPEELGAKALHTYCYLSTETVLFREAYLSQKPQVITFVSGFAKKFKVAGQNYKSRQLKKAFLLNPTGLSEKEGFKTASAERAIADLLYFNPLAAFDKKVNWKKVKALQEKMAYPLTPQRYAAS